MRRTLQITLPLAILAIGALIFWRIIANSVEPERRRFVPPSPQVTVRPLEAQSFQVTLKSQGTVRARTQSSLIPEVRGRVISVAPNFQEGAFFEEGDVLLEIDDRDYQAELVVADSALAQAELALLQEKARSEQAQRDWERLNPGQTATELTLRQPQLRQAEANFASAQARLETAKLNLRRTKVTAPFAGRVLSKSVDVGQFVSTGNELARIYAVDFAEVRLPLTASQVEFLNLPAVYRGSDPKIKDGPAVTLRSSYGGGEYSWTGRVVRSEGAIDTRTRQLFVVAQIENPYGETVSGRPPLKVGTFVVAEIEGKVLEDVVVVPRSLYRENSYVLVVGQGNHLERRMVNSIWEDDSRIIVRAGSLAGERLCLTDVPYALEGLEVATVSESGQPDAASIAGGSPMGGSPGGIGPRVDSLIAHFGEKLPGQLKEKLMGLKSESDYTQIGPVMREIRAWASDNGLDMPEGGTGRPRS